MASTNEPVIDAATIAAARSEYRCRNALLWIRTIAGMHYFGGAFDPEHMRSIANLAADALGAKTFRTAWRPAGPRGRVLTRWQPSGARCSMTGLTKTTRMTSPGRCPARTRSPEWRDDRLRPPHAL